VGVLLKVWALLSDQPIRVAHAAVDGLDVEAGPVVSRRVAAATTRGDEGQQAEDDPERMSHAWVNESIRPNGRPSGRDAGRASANIAAPMKHLRAFAGAFLEYTGAAPLR
jgi:hypothetical protein